MPLEQLLELEKHTAAVICGSQVLGDADSEGRELCQKMEPNRDNNHLCAERQVSLGLSVLIKLICMIGMVRQ